VRLATLWEKILGLNSLNTTVDIMKEILKNIISEEF
jgi:hypothetical protein